MLGAHHGLDRGMPPVQDSYCHGGSIIEDFQGLVGRPCQDQPLADSESPVFLHPLSCNTFFTRAFPCTTLPPSKGTLSAFASTRSATTSSGGQCRPPPRTLLFPQSEDKTAPTRGTRHRTSGWSPTSLRFVVWSSREPERILEKSHTLHSTRSTTTPSHTFPVMVPPCEDRNTAPRVLSRTVRIWTPGQRWLVKLG